VSDPPAATGLASSDPEERRLAAAALGQSADNVDVSSLMRALGDEDWRVRKEATRVARALAPHLGVLRALVEAIGPGTNVGLRNAAVEALGAFGADTVDAIAVALPNLDADSRKLATEALAACDHPTAFLILRDLAHDDDPNVRAAAVESVAQIGINKPDDAGAILTSSLSAATGYERLVVLDGLNQLGVQLPWAQIAALASDPILERAVLVAAGRSSHEKAAELLATRLQTLRGGLFDAALSGLCELLRSEPSLTDAVKAALAKSGAAVESCLLDVSSPRNEDLTTRRMAVLLLGCLQGAEIAQAVVNALDDDPVAEEAEEALVLLGDKAKQALLGSLQASSASRRARAVELMGKLFTTPESAVVLEVVSLLDDPDDAVVRAALGTLARIGDMSCFEVIADKLSDDHGSVRWSAEAALVELARKHPDAVRALVGEAHPGDKWSLERALVLGALSSEGTLSDSDERFLVDTLSSESAVARRVGIEALAAACTERAVDAVAFALTDEERDVQIAAVRALGRMRSEQGEALGRAHLMSLIEQGAQPDLLEYAVLALGETGGTEAVQALRPLASSAPAHIAVRAVEAIAALPEARSVDVFIDGLSHESAEVVKAVLKALAGLDDPRVSPHVGACLDHEAWDVRRLAADLLGVLGGESNIELLRAKLALEKEPLVRDAITRALETMGALRRTPAPAGAGGSLRPK